MLELNIELSHNFIDTKFPEKIQVYCFINCKKKLNLKVLFTFTSGIVLSCDNQLF